MRRRVGGHLVEPMTRSVVPMRFPAAWHVPGRPDENGTKEAIPQRSPAVANDEIDARSMARFVVGSGWFHGSTGANRECALATKEVSAAEVASRSSQHAS